MTVKLLDLGWENAGGETDRKIQVAKAECKVAGHFPITTNEGINGTMHSVFCDKCKTVYHYDSSD